MGSIDKQIVKAAAKNKTKQIMACLEQGANIDAALADSR